MNARIPTRPGWWLGQRNAATPRHTDNPEPHPVAVTMRLGALCVGTTPVTDPRWTWFAPIPGPAVCAALAEYGEAVAEAEASAESPILPSSDGVWDYMLRTQDKLRAAIRAERDGVA